MTQVEKEAGVGGVDVDRGLVLDASTLEIGTGVVEEESEVVVRQRISRIDCDRGAERRLRLEGSIPIAARRRVSTIDWWSTRAL